MTQNYCGIEKKNEPHVFEKTNFSGLENPSSSSQHRDKPTSHSHVHKTDELRLDSFSFMDVLHVYGTEVSSSAQGSTGTHTTDLLVSGGPALLLMHSHQSYTVYQRGDIVNPITAVLSSLQAASVTSLPSTKAVYHKCVCSDGSVKLFDTVQLSSTLLYCGSTLYSYCTQP